MGNTSASHEDMFQYALTRLHQVLLIPYLSNSKSTPCAKLAVLREDGKTLYASQAYQKCSVKGPQAEDLTIQTSRGVHEIIVTRKDEKVDYNLANLQSMTLTTRVPMDISIGTFGKSLRRGNAILSETTYFQLVEDTSRPHTYQFIFSVQGRIYENVNSSQWDSRTSNGEQNVDVRGWVAYDPVTQLVDKIYVQELNLKDLRPREVTSKAKPSGSRTSSSNQPEKRQFNQMMSVNLNYNEPEAAENPALMFKVNTQECWSLDAAGRLSKGSSGYISQDAQKGGKDVVEFNLNNELLVIGKKVVSWPSCEKGKATPVGVAYGASFIK